MSNSLRPHGLQPPRLLHPWDFSGKSTGVGCYFLLQGVFPTQGSNLGLPHCRQMLYHLSQQGSSTPFRYDLNQTPYDYTVEVRNRFKGLDDRAPEELWMEIHDVVQEAEEGGFTSLTCKKQGGRQALALIHGNDKFTGSNSSQG